MPAYEALLACRQLSGDVTEVLVFAAMIAACTCRIAIAFRDGKRAFMSRQTALKQSSNQVLATF
jgi:hypothetical protein